MHKSKRSCWFFLFCWSATIASAQSHLPYDFVVDELDVNGWALNPKWGAQVPTITNLPNPYDCPAQEPWGMGICTSTVHWADKSSVKCPDTIFKSVWFPGHINFGGAVLTGTIAWDDHSGDDDDYNISIVPDNGGGLTTTNAQAIRMEFDSDETIDHFHTSWWESFHHKVDSGKSAAKSVIDGKRAIAFGVFGLDCAHDCSTELHPVFALAIEINDDPADNTWAIFVRNWGNEGYCSSGTETIDDSISTFTFTLPQPQATNVTVTNSEFLSRGKGASGPSLAFVAGQGASLTFGFPHASQRERENGVIHLSWTVPAVAKRPIRPSLLTEYKPAGREAAEARVESLINNMSPAQKARYARFRPRPPVEIDMAIPLKIPLKPQRHAQEQSLIRPTADTLRDKRDADELAAIKRAYNGKLPAD